MEPVMDWDDPAERARLIERVGHTEYNRRMELHIVHSTVEIVNGHRIHTVGSKYGPLLVVGATGCAFKSIDLARDHANGSPKGPDAPDVWECNECGAQEYSTIINEADIQKLGCGKCGASEWHRAKERS